MTIDPKADLRDFLEPLASDWDTSIDIDADDVVVSDSRGDRTYPQVSIVSADSIVAGGGNTAATGIDPGGGGPIQDAIYLVQVDCWGGPADASVYAGTDTHPDVVARELGEAVAEACRVGADGAPAGYEWIMAEPPFESDDTDPAWPVHREIVTVRMKVTYGV